jgi:signal peptidase I
MATVNPEDGLEERRLAHAASGAVVARRLGEALAMVGAAVLLALMVRTLVVQPFRIPSGSMAPGLEAGDVVLVDKSAYGWSRAALPVDPWRTRMPGEPPLGWRLGPLDRLLDRLPERVAARPVRRGDVIVLLSADGRERDYVKRVVAVGGDRIALRGGRVVLNGRLLPCVPGAAGLCHEQVEGAGWWVTVRDGAPGADMPERTVPAGQYFVLGDNRAESADSRLPVAAGGLGMVADWQVVGKARAVMLSRGAEGLRWSRMGLAVA